MLKKRTVIGAFILLAIIGGTLWYLRVQRIMNAEPTRVYKVPETQKAAETEGGHWHGDEWHAEPHPVPKPVRPPEPVVSNVRAYPFYVEAPPDERQDSERPRWSMHSLDMELPAEDTPRPFKHLTGLELHQYDTDTLSDEEWRLFQYEFFFRMPKEWRDEHRKQRVELKKRAEFFEWYEEQFPGKGAGRY